MEDNSTHVNCMQCIHFAVSWDPNFPKACKLFGFKSAGVPSVSVQRDSGAPCRGFVKKAVPPKGNNGGGA